MISEQTKKPNAEKTKRKLSIVYLVPIFFVLLLSGCLSVEPFSCTSSFSAQVVDKNGKPLPGVYILYSYEGDESAIVERHSYVAEAAILVTDQEGRFKIPSLFQVHSLFKTGARRAIWPGYCPTTHSMFAPDSKTHKTVPPDNSNNPKAWADDFKGFCWRYSCWRDLTLGQAISPAQKKIRADLDAMLQSEQRLLDEKNPDIPYKSGLLKTAKGNWDGALADYTKAIELQTDYVGAYIGRGEAKTRKKENDLDGALADYTKAIELKPDSVDAYIGRGEVKNQKGDLNGALADYTKAIELKPDYSVSYFVRGQVESAQSNWDGALADFNKVIELRPKFSYAYRNRGNVKKEKGDLEGAEADFKKAIELGP